MLYLNVWSGLTHKLIPSQFLTSWNTIIKTLTDTSLDRESLNGRRHGEAPISSLQLIRLLDKQVRNRISSIREQGDGRYDGCIAKWFGSR
ncbi:hypothetical protein AtEden1_Chr4g0280611 [Arabidopsis thaliana]